LCVLVEGRGRCGDILGLVDHLDKDNSEEVELDLRHSLEHDYTVADSVELVVATLKYPAEPHSPFELSQTFRSGRRNHLHNELVARLHILSAKGGVEFTTCLSFADIC